MMKILIYMAFSLVISACTTGSKGIQNVSETYPLMSYMRYDRWFGMGDSLVDYPVDSILYNGLHVDGKSIEEINQIYGKYRMLYNDTLFYGMTKDEVPRIYPLTKDIEYMTIAKGEWTISDGIFMYVYFKTDGKNSNAIYGYQFNYDKILYEE